MISIPGTIEQLNDNSYKINIKALRLQATVNNLDNVAKTLAKTLKNALGEDFGGLLVSYRQPRGFHEIEGNLKHFFLESSKHEILLKEVFKNERLIDDKDKEDKKKKLENSHLHMASSEEVLDYGYMQDPSEWGV
mgnify:CR=1 FL=1